MRVNLHQSWCIIIIISVFLLYVTGSFSAPVRVTVEGFVGDFAFFPCSIPESALQGKTEEFEVFWRDDEGKKVCDITGGNRICKDPKYKDRVETFPEEYKKGNFSIKQNNIQKNNETKYICHITGPSQNHTITELHVKVALPRNSETEIHLINSYTTFMNFHETVALPRNSETEKSSEVLPSDNVWLVNMVHCASVGGGHSATILLLQEVKCKLSNVTYIKQ
ncbi:uncharacterized protein LOC122144007 [Cyprinus carpio]|uniref:Uncharacterized protein LOC122144007 n=1 Tax=Cyprinus carpio TaxID=7962 RepID=A0A9Q9XYV6_CYPCA|nr:uncharacterized protein LOC122144007 [Cyprinus carpio]